MKNIKTH